MVLPSRHRFIRTWIAAIPTAGVLLTSFVVSVDMDENFRFPKELLVRGEAILLLVLGIIVWIFTNRALPTWRRDLVLLMPLLAVAWTAVTTITSLHPTLSRMTLLWVAANAIIFLAAYITARSRSLGSIYAVLAAAMVNAVLAICQESRVWNPFASKEYIDSGAIAPHLFTSGFIGNPDDLGAYMVGAAIAAAALIVARKRVQLGAIVAMAVIVGGLAATQSITAIAATIIGILVVAATRSVRAVVIVAVASLAIAICALVLIRPLRNRMKSYGPLLRELRSGSQSIDLFERLSSNRATPILAAWSMFSERPLLGVGPGCFGYEYYFRKMRVERLHPDLLRSGTANWNFGETHCDHLQTLAVAGIPAYLIFIMSPVLVAIRSLQLRSDATDVRSAFARCCGPGLAVSFLALTLFQFPLELAAPTAMFVFLAATVSGWSQQCLESSK